MPQHTAKSTARKPEKPYADFPLFPHAAGVWAKKIRGKLHYFGPWSDPDAALEKYLDERYDLHAGRTPRVKGDGLTVRDLLNRFLTAKKHLVDTSEIAPRTFTDYHITCQRIGGEFGLDRLVDDLAADDFEGLRATLAETRGPVALGNEIQRVRVVFKYAFDAGLIDRPVRYGPMFKRPSKKVLRKARHAKGARMFEADEILAMLDAAGLQLYAMILLGINAGFGNADVAMLPMKALDLKRGWVDYPRPKAGVSRRVPLWPETMAALKKVLSNRPTPKDPADVDLVFITKYGLRWAKDTSDNPVSAECRKVLDRVTVKRDGKDRPVYRRGLGFYGLRHTFQTIGDGARDPIATRAVMGHVGDSSDMSAVYRETVDDDRLRAVTDHVRQWLFGPKDDE